MLPRVIPTQSAFVMRECRSRSLAVSQKVGHSFFFRSFNLLLSGYIHLPCSIALADHADNPIAWLRVLFGLKSKHIERILLRPQFIPTLQGVSRYHPIAWLRVSFGLKSKHRANSPLRPQFVATLHGFSRYHP